ncbi:KaiC domain-containing protein [Halolamina salifodinae]|uniref:KaiC domain protein n=1 Tax=Halolamina salifodinae TaxID=1202767 RepID=A0A8T4H1I3_9EURY|nr:KaiC domain-containing protein [Halolamina salifodinae]MBP1987644.1 KaiC domain protein [Halolamina salifodinae]
MSDEEEEDWFEQAMREGESEGESGSPSAAADAEEEAGEEPEQTAEAESETAESEETPTDSFGGFGDEEEADPFGGAGGPGEEQADPFGGSRGGGDQSDPFGGSRGEAAEGQNSFGEGDGFGGEQDGFGGRAGGRETGGDQGGFGGGFGGDEGFGGEEGFGDEAESFDEAELDSDIDRVNVGIEGLDEMILGGVPERSLMVSIGAAGTGKTTVGLQFLTESLENDERAIYITLEESREAILSTAEEKGWPFREWRDEGRLAIVAMDPIEMANSLASIRSDISRLVEAFDADRLVLDSVSLLEMMYDHPAERRSEVFDFARSLKRAGVTTMLTSEASSDDAYTSRYGIIEYLVDAVFILQYVRPSDFRETRLAVEIQKIRDANHSRETKPYEITNEGISVYRQANIF